MTTSQIIKQMDKEWDELFIGENSFPKDKLYPQRIRAFVKDNLRTLLESFGEEVVGEDSDYAEIISGKWVNRANELRAEQRLKMKEILEGVGK